MCGFLGNCSFEKKIPYLKLKNSSQSLDIRGPDFSGEYINENISVFHFRLSIIDLSEKANQPFVCHETKNVIIFNGEIYNFLNLREDLIKNHNIKFKTTSDTETILIYYQIYGIEKLLSAIDGMFAFAIWDNKKKELYLARDKIGEKPLFFKQSKNYGIIFGSSFKSVQDSVDKSKVESKKSLLQYLSLSYLLFDNTFDDKINSLEPGNYLKFNKNFFEKKSYWSLSKICQLPKYNNKDINFYTKELERLLEKSVFSRVIADVDIGCYFSGGLDSSLIADKFTTKNINNKCDHLFFDEINYSEKKYAVDIAKELGIQINSYRVPPPSTIADNFSNIVRSMDQPIGDTAYISNYYLSKNSSNNFKVVLTGDGGDELFAGYETFFASFLNKNLNYFLDDDNFFINFLKQFNFKSSYMQKIGLGYKVNKFFENFQSDTIKAHLLWRSIFSKQELKNFILVNDLNYDEIIFKKIKNKISDLNDLDLIEKCMFVDLVTWLPNNVLYKVDRASMAFSQECRIPILDPKIIEFAFRLPSKYKKQFFNKKLLVKKILEKKLSKKNIYRKKEGFNSPVGYWMAENKRFRSLTQDLLFSKNITEVFETKYIENLLIDHINFRKDNTYKIYNLLVLSQWYFNNK